MNRRPPAPHQARFGGAPRSAEASRIRLGHDWYELTPLRAGLLSALVVTVFAALAVLLP
jgi:hypothetical protein